MNDKNELNDIILNKGGTTNSNKKIILAVATLGIILIIVVMLMNSLSSKGTDNLPQAVLPPEPQSQIASEMQDEPLFEEIDVIEEQSSSDADLDAIAQKLKQESIQEREEVVAVAKPKPQVKKVIKKSPKQKKVVAKAKTHKVAPPATQHGRYYIQVGSFSKYKPNKAFLHSITNLGYNYTYHKVKNLNKVLVGPFTTRTEAKKARKILRSKVEPGAFLFTL